MDDGGGDQGAEQLCGRKVNQPGHRIAYDSAACEDKQVGNCQGGVVTLIGWRRVEAAARLWFKQQSSPLSIAPQPRL